MSYTPARSSDPPRLPARLSVGMTPAQLARQLLDRSVDELATVGREALIPVLPAPPLVATGALARTAEAKVLSNMRANIRGRSGRKGRRG